jgi:hypothetical protein
MTKRNAGVDKMLKVFNQASLQTEHKHAIEAFYNIYLGPLENDIDEISLSVEKTNQSLSREEMVNVEIDVKPWQGDAVTVTSSHGDMQTALELCFARTRRSVIRQRKLAAISA